MSSLEHFVGLIAVEPGCDPMDPGFIKVDTYAPAGEVRHQTLPTLKERTLIAGSMNAAHLYMLALRLGSQVGSLKDTLLGAAEYAYQACGASAIPPMELHRLVVEHWPPPAPSQSVRMAESLALLYLVDATAHQNDPLQPPTAFKLSIQQIISGVLGHPIEGGGGGGSGGPSLKLILKPIPHPKS